MAFAGYLVKIDATPFPNKFIALESYQVTPDQLTDEDDYLDGDGKLHRNVLPHDRTKAEFNTPPINQADNAELQALFPNTVSMAATLWNPRTGAYEAGTYYVPDITFEIYDITATDIKYKPIRIAFIEY